MRWGELIVCGQRRRFRNRLPTRDVVGQVDVKSAVMQLQPGEVVRGGSTSTGLSLMAAPFRHSVFL